MAASGNRGAPAFAATKVTCPPVGAGRVVLGPSKLRESYFRIVSEKGGSGRIERFDPLARTWSAAPESVTFNDVWNAPLVPLVAWSRIR